MFNCEIEYKENEPLSAHCTFRTGGNARIMLLPKTKSEVLYALDFAKKNSLESVVIGKGSNILFGDRGFGGAIIKISGALCDIKITGEEITAGCGISLFSLANKAAESSLGGLEFASGIPGTLGGGIYMNAGAYGGELKACVKNVEIITQKGEIKTLTGEEMQFGYRTSVLAQKGGIAVSAVLKLHTGEKEQIRAKMRELNSRRAEKQPLEYPSAGSTFKRPQNNFAGALIEQCGLKGFTIGGAQVSEKHAGFVINKGGATSRDILGVINHVKETVYSKTGIMLVPEVKMIGEF